MWCNITAKTSLENKQKKEPGGDKITLVSFRCDRSNRWRDNGVHLDIHQMNKLKHAEGQFDILIIIIQHFATFQFNNFTSIYNITIKQLETLKIP